jgi:hypothetical protein
MTFYVNGSAGYQSFGSPITDAWKHFKKTPLTPVFLIYTPSAWPGGPAFLCAFGMGSIETFVWARLLSTQLADRLCTTPFLMGELRTCPVPQDSETTKHFDSWGFEILGEAPSANQGGTGTPPPSAVPGSLAASPAEATPIGDGADHGTKMET